MPRPTFDLNRQEDAVKAIRAESDRVGWPTAHKEHDLDVDRRVLTTSEFGDPPTTFAWCLYESGTYLIPWCYTSDIEKTEKVMYGRVHHWYRWNGEQLTFWPTVEGLIDSIIHSYIK